MKIEKKVYKEIKVELDISLEEMAEYIIDNDDTDYFLSLLGEKNNKDYSISNKVRMKKDIEILNNEEFIKYIARLIKYENSDCLELLKEELNY